MAVADLFQARWSPKILEEVAATFERRRPDIASPAVERLIRTMNESTRDCLVSYPEELEGAIVALPDADDRHVIAAAVQSRAHAIVTWNLKDFPGAVLTNHRLEAIDPDAFLVAQYDLDAGKFMECVVRVRKRLANPSMTSEEYIEALIRHRLVGTAARLRPMMSFL